MANHLVAWVRIPSWPVQVAAQQGGTTPSGPLALAANASDRATVIDACTRAQAYGIQPGMPVWEARRRCRALLVMPHDPALDQVAATRIEQILAEYADTFRQAAVGCWSLPLYALGTQFSRAAATAEQLLQAIQSRTGFGCTIGLGTQLIVAQVAARVAAERGSQGCMVVFPGSELALLEPLAVGLLPGVGPRTAARLQQLGVATIGQLARVPAEILQQVCGPRGRNLALLAQGRDAGDEHHSARTVTSAWYAPREPCADVWQLLATIQRLSEAVGRDLRGPGQATGQITVQVTWADRVVRRRTINFMPRCDLDGELALATRATLRELLGERRLAVVRLAVVADDLGPIQQRLFTQGGPADEGRRRRLQLALDAVRHRFGPRAIQAGTLVGSA